MNSKRFFGLAGLLLCGTLAVGCAHSDECDCEHHGGEPVYSQHQPQHGAPYHSAPEYIEPAPGHPGPGYPPSYIPGPGEYHGPVDQGIPVQPAPPAAPAEKKPATTPKPMNTPMTRR